MKKLLFSLVISLAFISSKAQNNYKSGDVSDHGGYSFMILEGVSNSADAALMDSILLDLKDMVLWAKTDPVTKVCQVRVQDPRVVYLSIYNYLSEKGYKPSKEFSTLE